MEPLSIVGGQRERVGLWLLERLPEVTNLPVWYDAIGVERGGVLVGGCLYSEYSPCVGGGAEVRMWCAGHNWISRRVIKVMFDFPFRVLKCHRITAVTAKKNKACRKMLEELGFKLEGMARQGFGIGKDAAIYGLLRDELRWS